MTGDDIIANVKQGPMRGKTAIDHAGNVFYSFQGIPYGKPPVGDLRFKAPQPAESWSGVFEAIEEGNSCYGFQRKLQRIAGSEDCLFLNVYTPQLPSSKAAKLKPVMVWIHGGAFISGSGSIDSYGPHFLIVEEVVIVLINYRYGLLGFLNFNDTSLGVPGNAGLKDQVLALKWVKENIRAFNGDPDNVTVFGNSSGAASTHLLMLSPMTTGLFNRVIMQSASAFCCWARGQCSAPCIAAALGNKTNNERDLLEILQSMPVDELYKLQLSLVDTFSTNTLRPLGPVIEKPSDEPGFLLRNPLEIIQSGTFNKVPMIIGYNSREGLMASFSGRTPSGQIDFVKDFEKFVPYYYNLECGSQISKEIASRIKQFYFGEDDPSQDTVDEYYSLITDVLFANEINEAVKQHAIEGSIPVYYYRMSVESKLNKYKILEQIQDRGVCHADELNYLFKTAATPKIRPNSIEDCTNRTFVKLWTNFAKYGDPNAKNENPLINVKWNPVLKNQLHYLEIGENLTVGINPDAARMEFWNEMASVAKQSCTL